MDCFWSPNKGFTYGEKREEERRREKKMKKKEEPKGMETKSFCMDSCIHDFGMIFVQEFLRYDC